MGRRKRITGLIQARFGARRLPGKVLMPLAGRPVLWHVIRRLCSRSWFDEIVVATTEKKEDDGVVDVVNGVEDERVRSVRGAVDDVLERLYVACEKEPSDWVVRVGADTPLVCLSHLRKMVDYMDEHRLDMVSANPDRTGLTRGMECEVMAHQALVDAHLLAADSVEREHVSMFVERHHRVFRLAYPDPTPWLCSEYRLSLDYPEDYNLLRRLYGELYQSNRLLDCRQVLAWLRCHPEVARINAHRRRLSA